MDDNHSLWDPFLTKKVRDQFRLPHYDSIHLPHMNSKMDFLHVGTEDIHEGRDWQSCWSLLRDIRISVTNRSNLLKVGRKIDSAEGKETKEDLIALCSLFPSSSLYWKYSPSMNARLIHQLNIHFNNIFLICEGTHTSLNDFNIVH
jgi:hypothetical protein